MLTEGWDANTVTHVLGVRAFGTQLLCEQVVGRGLRRRSYALGEDGHFAPEYAEVYGVPVQLHPGLGRGRRPEAGPHPDAGAGHGGAHRQRDHLPPAGRATAGRSPTSTSSSTSPRSRTSRSTPAHVPTRTDVAGAVGASRGAPPRPVRGHAGPGGGVPSGRAPARPLLPTLRRDRRARLPIARGCSRDWSRSPRRGSPSASP